MVMFGPYIVLIEPNSGNYPNSRKYVVSINILHNYTEQPESASSLSALFTGLSWCTNGMFTSSEQPLSTET